MKNKASKYCLICFFMLFLIDNIKAQITYIIISGRVIDGNGKPIEIALLRVNNTSIYTESDSLGFFQLKIPEKLPKIEVVVSRVGFQSKKISISLLDDKKDNVITLNTSTELLEVKILGERSKYWKRKYDLFEDILLGNTPFRSSCKVLNQNDVIINVLDNDIMEVTYKSSLKILNDAFGYIIEIDIKKVSINHNMVDMDISSWVFIEQKPIKKRDSTRWERNREYAFNSSYRGFLLSMIHSYRLKDYDIYKQNTNRNQFYIYPPNSKLETEIANKKLINVEPKSFIQFDSTLKKYYITSNSPLLVFSLGAVNIQSPFIDAKYQVSYVNFYNSKFMFDEFGWSNSPIYTSGYWGVFSCFSCMLPQDYLPERYIHH